MADFRNKDHPSTSATHIHTENGNTVQLGPLLDDGAPYSGMGLEEILLLKHTIMPTFNGNLDPLPAAVVCRPFWQYGSGKHASSRRKILGSILLSLLSDQGVKVEIRHLIIEGSSPWIIGRNVTRHSDIIHRKGNYLHFSLLQSNATNTLQLINHDFHSYLPSHIFFMISMSQYKIQRLQQYALFLPLPRYHGVKRKSLFNVCMPTRAVIQTLETSSFSY